MKTRKRDIFTTIKTEGNLLPVGFLQRVAEGDKRLDGLAPETYHIGKNERLNEVINRAWKRCQTTWKGFQKEYQNLPDTDAGTTLTRERWLLVLFQELAYGRLLTSKAREIDGKSYPVSHFWNHTPIHLVSFRHNLDRRTPGVAGAARLSPHGLIQEFLNRSDDYLWGMVSNGLGLRLLRDNASLTRQAYVEFDLEGMMSGEVYSDFILLFLLLHQSRVEAEQPEKCWLEQWTRVAQEQGTRALDQLRRGVEQAITALGKGFLAHSGNGQIREKLRKGELSAYDLYQQLLRLVYRLIFLFVAEDRNLLLLPESTEKAKRLYLDHYSLNRFRRMAGRVRGTRHADLWEGLRVTFRCLYHGEPGLALDPLGGFLFSPGAMPDLNSAGLSNDALLEAIRRLSYTTEGRFLRPVDYRNLGTEELGSVYESLLELHPEVNTAAATFDLRVAAGSDRKTTGSYYTPSSLINCLLDSALEPVIENAIQKPEPEKALLDLKIVDPACGSGHFLIAAAHRMAKHLAMIRTGEGEPAPEERRRAIRDVVSHCIYGVDLNPLAVELCKVALWIETLDPGKPLGFLDHHIKCGNSLIGATPTLLEKGIPDDAFKPVTGDDRKVATAVRKKNRNERKWKQKDLFSGQTAEPELAEAIEEIREWGFMPEDSQQAVNDKADKYQSLMEDPGIRHAREVADLWTSAFFWPLTDTSAASVPTEDRFRLFQEGSLTLLEPMLKRMESLSHKHRIFHWHLEFPEVFGNEGGFDCVLGNPPWEAEELVEKEFFSFVAPEIADIRTKAKRNELIKRLASSHPELFKMFQDERRNYDLRRKWYKFSGFFPLGNRGKLNTYRLFAELDSSLLQNSGRMAQVLKTGIITAQDSQPLFQKWVTLNQIAFAYDFINTEKIFPAVVSNERFCLLTLSGVKRPVKGAEYAFGLINVDQLKDRSRMIRIACTDLEIINPEDLSVPPVAGPKDYEILLRIHKKHPVLRSKKQNINPWKVHYTQGHLNSASGSALFKDFTLEQLLSKGGKISKHHIIKLENDVFLPLYEGKFIGQMNHRFGTFDGVPSGRRFGTKAEPNDPFISNLKDPEYEILPRYWLHQADARHFFEKKGTVLSWLFVFRDVCRAIVDARTIQACVHPQLPCLDGCPILVFSAENKKRAASLALLLNTLWSAFIFDYVARQKIHGAHLTKAIAYQLPHPTPESFEEKFLDARFYSFIVPRSLELTVVTDSFLPFAADFGYEGLPFIWDDARRFLIRCELDAAFFQLYGIDRDEVDYIMETFPIVKRKDEQKFGEYRTKRVILECYDAVTEATQTGKPYQTIIDPPPGPPENGLPEWKPGQPKPKDWPSHIHAPKEVEQ